MTLVGSCHICAAPAMNTCSSCGKLVCRAHYMVERGICHGCTGTMAGVRGHAGRG